MKKKHAQVVTDFFLKKSKILDILNQFVLKRSEIHIYDFPMNIPPYKSVTFETKIV